MKNMEVTEMDKKKNDNVKTEIKKMVKDELESVSGAGLVNITKYASKDQLTVKKLVREGVDAAVDIAANIGLQFILDKYYRSNRKIKSSKYSTEY